MTIQAKLRLVFAGTPDFAVPCLQALLDTSIDGQAEVVAVYSQPDRPAGRGRKLAPSPVKALALRAGLAVYTPESLRDKDVQAQFAALKPDLFVVVAFGMILPKKILAIPRLGCWNVHASLLPRWRGAAPVQRAIAAGDSETGVCLMQMDAGLDTGPVILQQIVAIEPLDTGETLAHKLAAAGAQTLTLGLAQVCAGTPASAQEQSTLGVTYAHKLDKHEAALNFSRSAIDLARQVRAFVPFPIAQAQIAGEIVQVLAALAILEAPETAHESLAPRAHGAVVAASKQGIDIQCAVGELRITHLKRAGGNVIRAVDYLNARPELKSRASDTEKTSRASDTEKTSRASDTEKKSRASDTEKTSR
jgi:methionyl-tRNA formyltransferase